MRQVTIGRAIGAAVAVAGLLWVNYRYLRLSPELLREWVTSFGWVAPLLFVAMYIVRPFVLFPTSVLALAGGLSFGTWWGMLYTALGELAGAVLSFWAARGLVGKGFFRGGDDPRLAKLERAMERRGFMMVLLLRLAPFVPFDLVSYGAGAARVKMRAYLPATLIGSLPGTFAYSYLGASLTEGSWRQFAVAGAVFAAALALPLLLRRKVTREVGEDIGSGAPEAAGAGAGDRECAAETIRKGL